MKIIMMSLMTNTSVFEATRNDVKQELMLASTYLSCHIVIQS